MNPFEVLDISPEASPDDIKAAYHRLAKQWHPDRYQGAEKAEAEAKFRELAEAFSLLKDPAKRASFQQKAAVPPVGTVAAPFESPMERTPEDWAAMARSAFQEGQLDQARALIHYAIRMDGTKAPYHALLATVLEREGEDLRAVVKALEAAVRLDPRDVDSHLRLATHFQSLGMQARAQGHLQTAREIAPDHPKFRAAVPKGERGRGPKGKGAVPAQPSLKEQWNDLWSRLTGRGR
ncbi:DnaJ domain-containing protein [Geothrix sp. 21YS21S-4]|uniref:DnaJ domain-containing protein n=1 Tax=Geothrix sp. 21YS21S-4 TaxID=3068889 RepID=UPI0027B99E72|nr:DnaJ domain-containing protein [Geothrix sp. 21YS21S-4]